MDTVDRLLSCNIKPSAQRLAIMDWLVSHPVHPTVDEIWQALISEMPTLSKTTVYNTLRLFVTHGAAQMLTIDERNTCFDADVTPHSHFLCRMCGKIFDVPFIGSGSLPSDEELCGHQAEEVQQYYRGVCCSCSKKMKQ
jgi:Fe2+ or Zn2+ uptake regulation protein